MALLSGLQGVGHVIADAAYDADALRTFIADNLGASAQIKANPSRTGKPPTDWRLYKERHQVECFFNKLKRFRRIALRCEKTLLESDEAVSQVDRIAGLLPSNNASKRPSVTHA